jgi:hypothetical protein
VSGLYVLAAPERLLRSRLQLLPPEPQQPCPHCRSIPTTAGDRVYAKMLAHGAVHGAFAGYTGITVGLVNTHVISAVLLLTSVAPGAGAV